LEILAEPFPELYYVNEASPVAENEEADTKLPEELEEAFKAPEEVFYSYLIALKVISILWMLVLIILNLFRFDNLDV